MISCIKTGGLAESHDNIGSMVLVEIVYSIGIDCRTFVKVMNSVEEERSVVELSNTLFDDL